MLTGNPSFLLLRKNRKSVLFQNNNRFLKELAADCTPDSVISLAEDWEPFICCGPLGAALSRGRAVHTPAWPCCRGGLHCRRTLRYGAVRSYRTFSPLPAVTRRRYVFCCAFHAPGILPRNPGLCHSAGHKARRERFCRPHALCSPEVPPNRKSGRAAPRPLSNPNMPKRFHGKAMRNIQDIRRKYQLFS